MQKYKKSYLACCEIANWKLKLNSIDFKLMITIL